MNRLIATMVTAPSPTGVRAVSYARQLDQSVSSFRPERLATIKQRVGGSSRRAFQIGMVLSIAPAELRGAGLSGAKTRYIGETRGACQ